jgi:hypothetical protein
MKKRTSINWGNWLRESKPEKWVIDEIRTTLKQVKIWSLAALAIAILLVSASILLNYFVGLKSVEKIDASARQTLKVNEETIRQTLNAVNPNDFSFKPFENGEWYVPTPVNDYVKLIILPVPSKEISLYMNIKNNSDFPARNVYCMITFSNKEFVEIGNDIVNRLRGSAGLTVYPVSSSNSYLNEAAAIEWNHIPPRAHRAAPRSVDLTMRGSSGRLTIRINSINRLAFEFRLQESN